MERFCFSQCCHRTTVILLFIFQFALQACTVGGGGDITLADGTGSIGAGNYTLTVEKVYPTASGSTWTPISDSDGRFFVKGVALSIQGTCSRGISTVSVSSAGVPYSETASCDTNGEFLWSKSFSAGAEADLSLSLSGLDLDGNSLMTMDTATLVRVDDLAPNAPTITSPSSSSTYSATGTSYVSIAGSMTSDVVKLLGPNSDESTAGGTNFSISASSWSFPVTLTSDTTTAYSFYAYDKAGNISAAATLTIDYNPAIRLLAAGAFFGGSNVVDSGTSFSVEAAAAYAPNYVDDSGTSYVIETGFNRIVNQVRAAP